MRNPTMKTVVGINLIMAFVFTGVLGCDYLSKKPREISFLDDSFSVIMPASWSLQKNLNDNADLQMGNPFKEAYAVILSDNKMDLDNFSLDEHSNLTRSFITNSLRDFQESEPEYFYVGEHEAVRYQLAGTIDGIHAVYWHVTIETENYFHQFILWSLKSKFSKNEADFDAVIQSFEVIEE